MEEKRKKRRRNGGKRRLSTAGLRKATSDQRSEPVCYGYAVMIISILSSISPGTEREAGSDLLMNLDKLTTYDGNSVISGLDRSRLHEIDRIAERLMYGFV